MPDELAASLPRIRELVEALHAPVISLDGYEADDVIATLAKRAGEAGLETVIISAILMLAQRWLLQDARFQRAQL